MKRTLSLFPAVLAALMAFAPLAKAQPADDEPEMTFDEDDPSQPRRDAVTTAAAAQRVVASEQLEQEQVPVAGVSPEVDKLTRELEASISADASTKTTRPIPKAVANVVVRRTTRLRIL